MIRRVLIRVFAVALIGVSLSCVFSGGANLALAGETHKRIKKITVKGNRSLPPDFIVAQIKSHQGTLFSQKQLDKDAAVITDMGYFSSVEARVREISSDEVEIIFIVEENPRVVQIRFEDDYGLKEAIFSRELRIKEGDIYNIKAVRRSERAIEGIDYVKDVNISLKQTENPDEVTLHVQVKERADSGLIIGSLFPEIGFYPFGNSRPKGTWTRGILGRVFPTYRISNLKLGSTYNFIDIILHYMELGRALYNQEIAQMDRIGSYDEIRYGLKGKWGLLIAEKAKIYGALAVDRAFTDDFAGGGVSPSRFGYEAGSGGLSNTLGGEITCDSRDNWLNPTDGWYLSLRGETAPDFINDYGFSRAIIDLRGYLPFGSFHNIATRIYAGGAFEEMPFYEKFKVGGAYDLRGFASGRFLGDTEIIGNFEYRFPIYFFERNPMLNITIGGALFADVGRAWNYNTSHEVSFPRDVRLSLGGGLRLFLNSLPIRLDYGNDAISRVNEGGALYLIIGHFF